MEVQQTGTPRREALLQAADRRYRPIAMTALTTIIGMIPLTVQPASDLGLSYRSFGLTLIGCMIAATLLTLLLVPVFYTLFDDAREAFVRIVRGARVARRPTVGAKELSPRPAGSGAAAA